MRLPVPVLGVARSPTGIRRAGTRIVGSLALIGPMILLLGGCADTIAGWMLQEQNGELAPVTDQDDAEVLLFNWPSWIDFRTLPTANARVSGRQLLDHLSGLDSMVGRGDLDRRYPKRTLLVHSMGARVLKSMLDQYAGGFRPDLFGAVILTAAEVDLKDHAAWLERIDFARNVYVLVNGRDKVLAAPAALYQRSRLGGSLIRIDGQPTRLAQNAVYVPIDAGTPWHSHHLHHWNAQLADLLTRMVAADEAIAQGPSLAATDRRNVFALRVPASDLVRANVDPGIVDHPAGQWAH